MAFEPTLAIAFAAVAEEKSFTRAAALLGMTQPQVSLRIRRLEGQLGVRLLARNTRRVELTGEGETFFELAKEIVRAVEAAQSAAEAFKRPPRERLRIGNVEIARSNKLRNDLINAYLDRYPAVDLEIGMDESRTLYEELAAGRHDVLLIFTSPGKKIANIEIRPLQQLVGHVCVPREGPLARLNEVPPEALAGTTFVISSGACCPDLIDTLGDQMRALSITVHKSLEPSRHTLYHIAEKHRFNLFQWVDERQELGLAHTFLPDTMVQRPIVGRPFRINFSALYATGSLSVSARRFLNLAQELAGAERRVGGAGAPHSAGSPGLSVPA